MKKLLIYSVLYLLCYNFFCQGPGGVNTDLGIWLKADAGTSSSIDNNQISSWNDQSGNGNNLLQSTSSKQPTYKSNTYESINNNPVVKFNGASNVMSDPTGILGNSTYSDANIYIVSKVNSISSSFAFFEQCSPARFSAHIPWGNQNVYFDAGSAGGNSRLSGTWGGTTSDSYLWSMLYSTTSGQTIPSRRQAIIRNGFNITTDNTASTYTGTNQPFYLGGRDATPSQPWSANVAEYIVYTGPITATQHNKIESYLAIKYGLTLDNSTGGTSGDYTSSNGTLLWNADLNATYHNDVSGIGRDDDSQLDQQKSLTTNNGGIITIDKGGAFANDNDFILWGNDAAATTISTSAAHPSYQYILDRKWKATVSGTPGLVSISFTYPNSGNAADYALLLDATDNDFSSGATAHTTGISITGNTITFTGVTLVDGMYFTLGSNYIQPGPGGIYTDLSVWLKADVGTSSLATSWDDQSGYSNNYSTVSGPSLVTDDLNHNPSVEILSGGFNAPIGSELGTSWSAFFVAKKLPSDNNGRLFEGNTGNYLWGYHDTHEQSIFLNGNPNNYNSGIAINNGATNLKIQSYIFDNGTSSLEARANGNLLNTFSGANSASGIAIDINQGSFGGSQSSDSKIGEMIIYNTPLSPIQVTKVESYLAIKYGLTLDNSTGGTAGDYTSSNGTLLWDADLNVTYHNDVTGIGRDDDSQLDQQKSLTTNNGGIITIDKGGAFSNDNDFILWGNDAATGTSTDVTGYEIRTNKIWKVATNGTPGLVNISVNLAGLGFGLKNATAASFALLIDDDGAFAPNTAVHTTGASLANGILSFTNVNLNDGDFFAIAGPEVIAPGDVKENLVLWLKADADVAPGTNNSAVTEWKNQTGTTNEALQVADAPDFLTDQVNFNPAIDFNGNNDYLQIAGGILGNNTINDLWIYSVTKPETNHNGTLLYEDNDNGRIALLNPWSNRTYLFSGNTSYNPTYTVNTNEFEMWTHASSTSSATPSGKNMSISRNGAFVGSGSNNNSTMVGNGANLTIGGGWNNGTPTNNNFNGKIAEIIVYNGIPSPIEQERIQSYLAIKYGITKNTTDNVATPTIDEADYIASDGTTILWDYSLNSAYHNNVTGIGRDDNSTLNQQKSQSSNQGGIITIDKGGAFSNDNDFILWGNDAATGTSTDVTGYEIRTNKIWKVATNGTPGLVNISVNLAGLGFGLKNATAASFALLIDDDGAFAPNTAVHTTGASLANGILSFTNVNLNDGDFFAIAGPEVIAPGDVKENLALWLKADADVAPGTNNSAVTEWKNQTGTTNEALQVADAPDFLTDQVNFNPAIDFNGNNDYLQIAGGILGNNTINDLWIYSVTKPETNHNGTLLYEDNDNGRIALLNPWSNRTYLFSGNTSYNPTYTVNTNEFEMWTHASSTSSATPSGKNMSISRNGAFVGSGSNNNSTMVGNGANLTIGGGWNNGTPTNNNFNGKIAEIIVYNGIPSPIEQERIQSYLAIKYGITKNTTDNVATPTIDEADYIASDGTTILWDYSLNSAYHNNVTGIGRDDNSTLNQQKSQSSNQGGIITIDKGGAFSNDNDFILWGNDAATGTSTDVTGYEIRTNKIWKVATNGTPGLVNISVNLAGLGFGLKNATAASFALLIDDDGAFAPNTAVHTTGASLANGILSFTNVNLNDGDFFAIAGPEVIAPGDVKENLALWLKADADVAPGTNNSAVTEWKNQTGTTNEALQVADAPDFLTDQVNFNPAIDFNGNNDYLQIAGGILGNNTINDLWIYSVTKPETNHNGTLLYEDNDNGRIALLNPWSNRTYLFSGNTSYNPTYTVNTNEFEMWTHASSTSSATPSGTNMSISRNGAFVGSGSNNNSTMVGNGANLTIGGGWNNGTPTNNNFNGKIAEIIVYNGIPSPIEQERIQSYLAIKYGITKNTTDNVATPTIDEADYIASDGTTILWDYSLNSAYHNNVTGIGRDDNSTLNQQKSQSSNQGGIITIDKGGAFSNDNDFILWGNDAATGTSTDVTGYEIRTNKIWKVATNGTPGLVNISVNLAGLGFGLKNATAASFALLIDDDGAFAPNTAVHTTGASLANGILSFTNVNLNDGDFFAIAGPEVIAPGDVKENLALWLKADADVAPGTNNSAVTEWKNQTGTTNEAIQVADAPDLLTDQVNFNPAIDFNGNNDYLQIAGGILGNNTVSDLWIYSVTKPETNHNGTLLYEDNDNGRIALLNPWSNRTYLFSGNTSYNPTYTVNTNEFEMWTHASSTSSATPSGTNMSISRNGAFVGSGSNNNSTMVGNGANLTIGGGWNNGTPTNNNFNGKIAEIIVYNGIPSPIEQERIQSYLAIKYGITKNTTDNVATPTIDEADYIASDGTTILWDYSLNSAYHNNVTGIGRDDNSTLNQQKSKSSNQGGIITIDKGGAFPNDNDFILWGNDAATGTSTDVTGYEIRTNKIWKVATNGTPGLVNLSINLAGLGFGLKNATAASFALLIDDDGAFAPNTAVHTTGASLANGILSFTNVNLNDGDFFAIAGPEVIAPGDVKENLALWLKADADVAPGTNNSAVTEWKNQTGTTNEALQVVDAPDFLTDQVNFNPAIDFNGNNDYLQIAGGILGNNTVSDLWIYSVTKPETNHNGTLLYEDNDNGRIALLNPWSNRTYLFSGNTSYNPTYTVNTNEFEMWTHASSTSSATPSGKNMSISRNGAFVGSGSNNNSTMIGNGANLTIGGGWSNGTPTNNNFNGKIAEIIVYNGIPSPLEQERVQSYLAIKYGITKNTTDNVATPTIDEADYIASDGTTILWDYSLNSAYHNNVTGIGRDDNSTLNQQKSKSSNQGGIITIDKGGAFPNDNDFILWGNDAAATTISTSAAHPSYQYILDRKWKATVSGTPGLVSISFTYPNSGNAADYALLLDVTDNDFSSGATAHTTGVSITGNTITFTGVNLVDGIYFTLGTNFNTPYPGGISNNLSLWLKADAGVTGTTNVTQWNDNTFNSSNATATNGPSLKSNSINFNPSLTFDGTNEMMKTADIMPEITNQFSGFMVIKKASTSTSKNILAYQDNSWGQLWSYGENAGSNNFTIYSQSPSGWRWNEDGSHAISTNTQILSADWINTGNLNYYADGELKGSRTETGIITDISNSSRIIIGARGNGGSTTNFNQFFDGEIAEVVYYNSSLTNAEQNQVWSYLAIKYGLTLGNSGGGVSGDYTSSSGTLLWDADLNASYHNDVTGIGRDGNSGLNQLKSITSNTGGMVIMEKTGTFSNDESFVLWGNDAAATTLSTSGAHPSYQYVLGRKWKASVKGTPGTVDISINYPNSGIAADYALLLDAADNDFSSGATAHKTGVSFSGNTITFTGVVLTDGMYFTLGTNYTQPAPGGISDDLAIWLKADAGSSTSTEGDQVVTWNDQSGKSNHATQNGGSDLPTYTASKHNFNPAIYFPNGDNGYFDLNLDDIKNSDYNLITILERDNSNAYNYLLGTARNSGNQGLHYGFRSNTQATLAQYGNDIDVNINGYNNPKAITLLHGELDQSSGKTITEVRNNSTSVNSHGNTAPLTGTASGQLGRGFDNSGFEGHVSEVIAYSSTLTDAEKDKIYSYLAIKYGFTLDNSSGGAAGDYTSSNGTLLWDADVDVSYHNDVTGIGRDDNSQLNQLKSITSNTGGMVIMEKTGTFSNDESFVLWGNDAAATTLSTSGAHPSYQYVLGRKWKASVKGTPGTVDISINYPNSGIAADYALLLDAADNDFSSGATAHTTGVSFSGNTITFTGVVLTDGMYFTLGTDYTQPAPGGISDDLAIWLKADAGSSTSTDGDQVVTWNDQSGKSNHATQNGGSDLPTYTASKHNFNPAVYFPNGDNGYFDLNLDDIKNSDYNLITILERDNSNTYNYLLGTARNSGNQGLHYGFRSNTQATLAQYGNDIDVNINGYNNPKAITLLHGELDQNSGKTITEIRNNSTSVNSHGNTAPLTGTASGQLGRGFDSRGFEGHVSEVIAYSSTLTDAEKDKIYSYLAIKYGFTLDNSSGGAAGDYTSSNGTLLWDADVDVSYHNDVTGIGRDDGEGLYRKQAKTVDDSLIIYINNLAIDNSSNAGTISTDNSYLIVGNNKGSLKATTASNNEKPSGIESRFEREWKITNTNFNESYSLKIEWDSVGAFNIDDIRLLVDDDGDFSDATVLGSAQGLSFTLGSIIVGGIGTSHIPINSSRFLTIGSVTTGTPLPIELIEFTCEPTEENFVHVKWKTAMELNNDYFTIERSENIETWDVVSQIDGAGNSNDILEYDYLDENPFKGNSYYRLKQTDFDGQFEYSPIAPVSINSQTVLGVTIFPNPSDRFINVELTENGFKEEVTIYNTIGENVTTLIKIERKSVKELKLDLGNLSYGVYHLKIKNSLFKVLKE